MAGRLRLEGVFSVLPTAFQEDAGLDLEGTAALTRAHVAAGVAGGLALLAKQNSGVLALVFLGAAALVSALPDAWRCVRAVLQFGAGAALVAALFAGWLWTFSLAAFNRPTRAWHMALAAAIGLALSLGFRRAVMGFFRADLGNLGDRITDAYIWTIVAFVTGLVGAGYVLAGGPVPFRH